MAEIHDIRRHIEEHREDYKRDFFRSHFPTRLHPKALLQNGCCESERYSIEQRIGTLLDMASCGYDLTTFVGWYLYTWGDYERNPERYISVRETLTHEVPRYGFIAFLLNLAMKNGISIPGTVPGLCQFEHQDESLFRDTEHFDTIYKILEKDENGREILEDLISHSIMEK